jgi:3-dehydroquinate synthetase
MDRCRPARRSRTLARNVAGRHALVISNSTVAPLYLDRIAQGLDGLRGRPFLLDDGEAHKSFANVGRALEALGELGATRDACVIALGGGVVGDLAGFSASCWMRGIDFIQMPTTLLAMVDSSVGGKTGVNLPAGKNLAGAFHQPRAVIADLDTLATLPDREYRAGLAEVVKGAAIGDEPFFAWLEQHADALASRDAGTVMEAIARKVRYKAGVVARDETEQGERALLNLGHTFGHALETAGTTPHCCTAKASRSACCWPRAFRAPGHEQARRRYGRDFSACWKSSACPRRHPGRHGRAAIARTDAAGQEEHRRHAAADPLARYRAAPRSYRA